MVGARGTVLEVFADFFPEAGKKNEFSLYYCRFSRDHVSL